MGRLHRGDPARPRAYCRGHVASGTRRSVRRARYRAVPLVLRNRRMRAIILAAGRGSRMGQLTAEIPKCLVQLGGKPLLEWQTGALRAAGIDRIAVVTG